MVRLERMSNVKRVRRALRMVIQLVDRPKVPLKKPLIESMRDGEYAHFMIDGEIEPCQILYTHTLADGGHFFNVHSTRHSCEWRVTPSAERFVLVVTGSRQGRNDTWKVLDEWVKVHGDPVLVIVGDAHGVDAQVRDWATSHGYEYQCLKVNHALKSPRMFLDRNERMIDYALTRAGNSPRAVRLVALPVRASRGTHHCYNTGRKAGIKCTLH
jgi:hypothetical protein